jgi:hypothetical protein
MAWSPARFAFCNGPIMSFSRAKRLFFLKPMARAKRHYIPGYIWHITHRCRKKEFLLKFSKDRHRYLQWLYQARKRYGLTVLDYMVTSNHLLVVDDGDRDVIGRTGQKYSPRKDRKGAYREDRYHPMAVETEGTLRVRGDTERCHRRL